MTDQNQTVQIRKPSTVKAKRTYFLTERQIQELEAAYRSGTMSLAAIGKNFGCSRANVCYYAKKYGWVRDLAPQVRQRTAEKLSLMAGVQLPIQHKLSDGELVEAVADQQAMVMVTHRTDIAKYRRTVARLFSELDLANDATEVVRNLIENMPDPSHDKAQKEWLSDVMKSLNKMGLSSRAGMLRDLAQAAAKLYPLEQAAYGVREKRPGEDALVALILRINGPR